jgi:hypothetical protein
MKKNLIQFILGIGFVLTALPAMAQQTSNIAGKVSSDDGNPLPGVVVSIASDRLQGTRDTVTREDGSFLFKLLPPGSYTITATMPGMITQKKVINVGLGQTNRPRIVLSAEALEVALTVTGDSGTSIMDTTEVATSIDFDDIEDLPSGRSINAAVALSPGVTTGGPNGALQISGAQSFENLFMINGVVVNENVRGQPHSAYIEDAIQEVSVLTGAISAEYGHFTGGVVNTLTKSGGNNFSGTFRVHFDNDSWRASKPGEVNDPDDKTNHIETFTVGGPIMKDKLWFFIAGRRQRDESQTLIGAATPMTDRQVRFVNRSSDELGYELAQGQQAPGEHLWPHKLENDRVEMKLTALIGQDHTIVASYLFANTDEYNNVFGGALAESAFDPFRSLPNTLFSINYRGIITPELTVDALYSQKKFTFEDSGGNDFSLAGGTPISAGGDGRNIGAPYFSAITDEHRDNESMSLKLSYYLTTDNLGSHDIVAGISELTESREADNHQSGSDWRAWSSYTYFTNLDADFPSATPIYMPDNNSFVAYYPIMKSSQGSDFRSDAIYFNDSWVLSDHWRFNLGIRYDKNNTKAQDGTLLSDSSMISPRLAVTYDIFGDGRHNISAGYGRYVAKIANAADSVSTAGTPAILAWYYAGTATDSLQDVFDWFQSTYDVNLADGQEALFSSGALSYAFYVNIPGGTNILPEPLESPLVDEYSFGYSTRLGNRGLIKLDYIHREYDKFYVDRITQETGTTYIPGTGDFDENGNEIPGTGQLADLTIMDNSKPGEYTRDYDSVQMQFQFNWDEHWSMGMNYTWAQLVGNIEGETGGSGSVTSGANTTYPEFKDFPNYNPTTYLGGDLRNKVDMWTSYDLSTAFGDFNITTLFKYQSAPVYEGYYLSWNIDSRNGPTFMDFGLPDPSTLGYITPPTSVSYFVEDKDTFKANDFSRIDLAVNYSYNLKKVELFVELEVFNVFNQATYFGTQPNLVFDTDTVTPEKWFNVYTEKPIEGVHYTVEPAANQRNPSSYQYPRWFQFDVGFKF